MKELHKQDGPHGVVGVWLIAPDVVKLLRHEQAYQRAKVRRIIKAQQRWKFNVFNSRGQLIGCMTTEPDGDYLDLLDLLAALNRRTK